MAVPKRARPRRTVRGGLIILIGFMGSGKTTVGRALARRLRWRFLDLDRALAARAGMSVPAVFRTLGERRFRRLEHRLIRSLTGRRRLVVAAGGGAPAFAPNRPWLRRAGLLIHLAVPVRILVRRLGAGTGRPLLAPAGGHPGRLAVLIARLLRKRRSAYAACDLTVRATAAPSRVAARLDELTRGWRRAHAL